MAEVGDLLNRKIAGSVFALEVPETGFALALKGIQTQVNIFRPENIPLTVQDEELISEAGKIRGAMTVTLDGEEMTLQKAGDRLFWTDRAKREEAWTAVRTRHYQDVEKLDTIFDSMVKLRTQKAKNANFDNYRDYAFTALRRYDYMPENCYIFHEAIEKAILPLVVDTLKQRSKEMHLDVLRPWDTVADPQGRPPLKAFKTTDELTEKTITMMDKVDRLFGDTVRLMHDRGHLDLASRPHKRPGGYMMPMPVSKIPFIFANATEKVDDLTTMIHEAGHAVHEIQMRNLRLMAYTNYPSEVAELGSMTMELVTLDEWSTFFSNEDELRRAKWEHLEGIIAMFPWLAMVDAFQHEVYLQPTITPDQRHDIWSNLTTRFDTGVDWSGFEGWRRTNWHRQGHIFENPFYYIEYGIAQLGALQIWRNFKQDKKQALEQYKNALALGYTKSIPEVYEAAGVKFDFSVVMIKDLMDFVQKEMAKLV
jgi:oligoendopeptidase F